MAEKIRKEGSGVSRREFLKISGAVAAGAQLGAIAGAGVAAGKDPSTFTGWQHQGDNTQFVDRKSLEIEGLGYEIVGERRRPEEVESALGREGVIMQNMMPPGMRGMMPPGETGGPPPGLPGGLPGGPRGGANQSPPGNPMQMMAMMAMMKFPPMDRFSEPLRSYYQEFPKIYELDKIRMESVMPKKMQDTAKYGDFYRLIDAYSDAWGTDERITSPPEESDFSMSSRTGEAMPIPDPVPFKSPELAAELIKKMAHLFGATMVGIAKLNPDWCYNYGLRGSKDTGSYKVPEHWEYVIAFGVPQQWEQVMSNPNMGTSFDAYARATIAARRLERYIKNLGYPARRHSPMDGYDLIGVPILQDAGLGTQGRHGICITPETGSNFRSAFVTTNLPMAVDKPIDFGVNEFCQDCKICAEICPSSSISFEKTNENMTYRGYRHWQIDQTSCFNFWMQSMGGIGCRLCLIACPFSRKNNWLHATSRLVDKYDPTGLANNTLTWMQKTFFKYPDAQEYLPPPDGRFATYREPAEWLQVKKYLDIEVLDPTKGE